MLSEYKRFISYIYAYDRGIKSKNVGFAKMEVRNGECRISINIKGAFAASGKELKAYLFHRQREKMIGIRIGSFAVKNGMGEFYGVTAAKNICGSNLALEEMSGIILCHEDETVRMYASGWDDHALILENFIPVDRELALTVEKEELSAAEIIPVMEAVEEELARLSASINAAQSELDSITPESMQIPQPEQAALIQPEPDPMPQPEPAPVIQPGPEISPVTEPVIQPSVMPEIQPEPTTPAQPMEIRAEEQATQNYCPYQEVMQEQPYQAQTYREPSGQRAVHNVLWSRLENTFPKVIAFEDEPEIPCLKIDLKDLEYLPKENWGLANNSFLLHGYYNFRYLILAKMGDNQYMIGIPGMFHNNERFMAAMFGFDHFKPVKEYKPLTGHFGYWYQWLTM